jgi:DNA-binding response OmpR family regulator
MALRAQSGGIADSNGSVVRAGSRPVKLGILSPVLIVEDNYLAAAELSRILGEWQVDARLTRRVRDARELARQMQPRLALVDINLAGGYEGVDLAQELQALYGTKIVFVTAYTVRDLMRRLTGAENMAVVFKPVDRDVLSTVLSKVCTTITAAH